jgi:hypothetical protein
LLATEQPDAKAPVQSTSEKIFVVHLTFGKLVQNQPPNRDWLLLHVIQLVVRAFALPFRVLKCFGRVLIWSTALVWQPCARRTSFCRCSLARSHASHTPAKVLDFCRVPQLFAIKEFFKLFYALRSFDWSALQFLHSLRQAYCTGSLGLSSTVRTIELSLKLVLFNVVVVFNAARIEFDQVELLLLPSLEPPDVCLAAFRPAC